jgi:pSer/pThr/pTyr-binding forkhead associated (FHA) protein
MKIEVTSGGKKWQWSPRDGVSGFTVGQRQGNDVVLPDDPKVSNLHLRIDQFLRSWTFTDQMSDTGTRHNGEDSSTGNLAQGDVLKIGDSVLRIVSLEHSGFPGGDTSVDSLSFDPGGAEDVNADVSSPSESYDRRQIARADHSGVEPQRGEYGAGEPTGGNYSRRGRGFSDLEQQPSHQPPTMQYQTQRQAPQYGASGQKKSSGCGISVLIVSIVVVFFLVGIGMDLMESSGNTSMQPDTSAADTETARAQQLFEASRLAEAALTQDEELPLLERLNNVKAALDHPGMQDRELSALQISLRRVQGQLRNALRTEFRMQNTTAESEVSRLINANQPRQAAERLQEHKQLIESDPEYTEAAEAMRITPRHDVLRTRIDERNSALIHETLLEIDKELHAGNYAEAADKIEYFVNELIGNETNFARFRRELAQVRALAERTPEGEPEPAFRAGSAPRNELTPERDIGTRRALSTVSGRLTDLYRDGKLTGKQVTLYGRDAELLEPDERGARWHFRVRRPLPGSSDGEPPAVIRYEAAMTYSRIPAATRARLLADMPNLSVEDRMGILHFCFSEGEREEALRHALELQRAHPEVKDHLHVYLAAKLNMELPEGGFVERDGMLAPAE